MNIKTLINRAIYGLGLEIDGFPNEGVALLGYWIRPRRAEGRQGAFRAGPALERCLQLNARSVMDVGSGGGAQATAFGNAGLAVTCVDYGSSVYAQVATHQEGHRLILGDFNKLELDETFDLVWSSHCLEHQRNVGQFLENMVKFTSPDGWICITVPVCHRAMWGGHLTLWTPGLLAYNLALTGADVSKAELIHGHREFSVLFQPRKRPLPDGLTYDSGDIAKLADRLPSWCREGADSW